MDVTGGGIRANLLIDEQARHQPSNDAQLVHHRPKCYGDGQARRLDLLGLARQVATAVAWLTRRCHAPRC